MSKKLASPSPQKKVCRYGVGEVIKTERKKNESMKKNIGGKKSRKPIGKEKILINTYNNLIMQQLQCRLFKTNNNLR